MEIETKFNVLNEEYSLEHQLRYKKDVEFPDDMAEELYECARISADLDLRMEKLRRKVFSYSDGTVRKKAGDIRGR